jgi:hypothetical protein
MSIADEWGPVGVGLGLMVAGPGLAATRAIEPMTGLVVLLLGFVSMLMLVLGLPIVIAIKGRKDLIPQVVVSLLAVVPLVVIGGQGRDVPPINDITTDLIDPPTITVEGRPILDKHDLNYPVEFVDQVRAGYPGLIGKTLPVSRQEAFVQVEAAARATPGWTLHRVDAASGVIEGSEETAVFHFVDDFSIRVVGTPDGAMVHMRSRSRDGRSDLGKNAERIRSFLKGLRK